MLPSGPCPWRSRAKATLGSVLLNRDALIPIASWLLPDDYHHERHALIFDAILAYAGGGVCRQIRARLLKSCANAASWTRLVASGTSACWLMCLRHRITWRLCRRRGVCAAIRRRLIDAGGRIAALGYNEQGDLETLIAEAQALVVSVTQRMGTRKAA